MQKVSWKLLIVQIIDKQAAYTIIRHLMYFNTVHSKDA